MNKNACTQCGAAIEKVARADTARPFCSPACYGHWQQGKSFLEQGKRPRPAKFCAAPGCERRHSAKGLCRPHYLAKHHGHRPPDAPPAPRKIQPKPCKLCGAEFLPKRESAAFCSSKCYGGSFKKPFILKNGYKKVLLPAHPRADRKGYVFEHIVVVEARLGRALAPGEEVHHRDFDRANNAPSNLLVCESHAEHMKIHAATSGRRA